MRLTAVYYVNSSLYYGKNGGTGKNRTGSCGYMQKLYASALGMLYIINMMCPEQQWKFTRKNRNLMGHKKDITFSMQAGL